MNETVFTNARLITPDAVVEGTLAVRDGRIVSLDNGASSLPNHHIVDALIEMAVAVYPDAYAEYAE